MTGTDPVAPTWPLGHCGDPGPSDAHCTLDVGHRYSCYDGSADVSFNARQDFRHDCDDPRCRTPHFTNEGD
ncbi:MULTISPECIES: hypothetical protein [Gordonia]|uniref:Uncharacterized protein n=1 Tax=Gordonia sihwensis NBRC 108236 TaxID=1223544 RepID=L7LEZ3_9ACTN|nr:hypothetical protein [Gordonia sihwensis]WFN93449.1 hypothetical protein P5P27_02425 [Gordonia sihwensis]GAC59316.1 hypothetical protein GSI01S_01_02820 [Gordonia sihwensis NBRC 108236]